MRGKITVAIVSTAIAVGLMTMLFSTPASAMLQQLNLKDLTDQAQLILTGHVADVRYVRPDKQGVIYTSATIAVERYLKGERTERELVVQVPGGIVGDIGLWIPDAPEFSVDQEVLLFLEGKDTLQPVGWRQGKYTIKDGLLLENGKSLAEVSRIISMIVDKAGAGLSSLSDTDLDMTGSELAAKAQLAYIYSGRKWPGPKPMGETFVVYENTADCTGEGAAVQAAGAQWSNVSGADFQFVYGGPTQRPAPEQDGHNVIRWDHRDSSVLGTAYIWYYVSSGYIFEADIVFNDYYLWNSAEVCPYDRYDIQSVAAHEMGHWLSLKDLYDNPDPVMYGYCMPGQTVKRTLHSDDIAGLRYIYPAPCDPLGVPNTLQPADGTSTEDKTPTFSWETVAEAIGYELQIADEPTYATPEINVSITDTSYEAPTALPTGPHYWRVRAYNDCGPGSWTATSAFTVTSQPPKVESITPADGECKPQLQKFTAVFSDPDGWNELDEVYLLISATGLFTDAIYVRYNVPSNRLYLRDPTDTYWKPSAGLKPDTLKAAEHTYAKLLAQHSSVIKAGNILTVTWGIKFKKAFSPRSTKTYLLARDRGGLSTGWQERGAWRVNFQPAPVYLSPSQGASGTESYRVFTTRYQDKDGAGHIQDAYLLITDTLPSSFQQTVYVRYNQVANRFYLWDDVIQNWAPAEGIAPTEAISMENDYCGLSGLKATVQLYNATTLQVKWYIKFKDAFRGFHKVFLKAVDPFGSGLREDSGWREKGTWRVK